MIKIITSALFLALLLGGCSSRDASSFGLSKRTQPTVSTKRYSQNSKKKPPTMRPYNVFGKWYYPTVVSVGERFEGVASWYGPNFNGKKTSNGEIYDMYAYTAAHKTLPMNTVVRVINKENGKSVVVRINDRGPFVASRIIDLSNSAARDIDMVKKGTAQVKLTVLGFQGKESSSSSPQKERVINNFFVQIGSFKRIEGAEVYRKRYENTAQRYGTVIKKYKIDGEKFYRVWLSGFRSEEEARDFVSNGKFPYSFITRD